MRRRRFMRAQTRIEDDLPVQSADQLMAAGLGPDAIYKYNSSITIVAIF